MSQDGRLVNRWPRGKTAVLAAPVPVLLFPFVLKYELESTPNRQARRLAFDAHAADGSHLSRTLSVCADFNGCSGSVVLGGRSTQAELGRLHGAGEPGHTPSAPLRHFREGSRADVRHVARAEYVGSPLRKQLQA
jgi:hypothetical protein